MKNFLKSTLPTPIWQMLIKLRNLYFDGYALKSYSQEGEDMILRRVFEKKSDGFYVDVGAHHPKRFSNTYFFYKRGWKGINIDAMPGSMKLFDKVRGRDKNLELGVGEESAVLSYYIFNEPALNGFSQKLSEERNSAGSQNILLEIKEIEVRSLAEILDDHLPAQQNIDFLSIDVEGFDLKVLKSNNWSKYRPDYVLVEVLNNDFKTLDNHPISDFMQRQNYVPFAKCMNTVFFAQQRVLTEK